MAARLRRAAVALSLCPLAACAPREAPRDVSRDTSRPVAVSGTTPPTPAGPLASPVDESAPEMLDAIRHARATLPELLRRLHAPPPTQAWITAKVRLTEGSEVEHIWLDGLRLDGQFLAGALNDDPVVLRRVRRGDPVRVRPGEIVDWMAVDAGSLCGGYSVRLERRHLPDTEREALDRGLGIVRVPADSAACPPAP
jgi:uncharacterized protein YegJ (DUF2314 family)